MLIWFRLIGGFRRTIWIENPKIFDSKTETWQCFRRTIWIENSQHPETVKVIFDEF